MPIEESIDIIVVEYISTPRGHSIKARVYTCELIRSWYESDNRYHFMHRTEIVSGPRGFYVVSEKFKGKDAMQNAISWAENAANVANWTLEDSGKPSRPVIDKNTDLMKLFEENFRR